jgi:hypothetical protein
MHSTCTETAPWLHSLLIPNWYYIKLGDEELCEQIDSEAKKDCPLLCPVYYDSKLVSGQVRHSFMHHILSRLSWAVLRENAGHVVLYLFEGFHGIL